jgi:hypothetical protein
MRPWVGWNLTVSQSRRLQTYGPDDIHVSPAPPPLPSPLIRTFLADMYFLQLTPAVLLAVLFSTNES